MISKDMLQNFINGLNAELSPKSVRAIFSMLRLCLKAANERNLISDVYSNIRLPKITSKEVKVLTQQEQKRFEQVISDENNENDIGILICLYTGIRIGELCALQWDKVNTERKMITIDKTLYRVKEKTEIRKQW